MCSHAKNGRIQMEHTEIDYVVFGRGQKNLVLIPGLSDGIKTVKGTALLTALHYRTFTKGYRVFVFSRKNRLEEGDTTRDMARDEVAAMDALGIKRASIVGISQGGMIAQYIAIDHPERVEKLALCVSIARQNPVIQSTIGKWRTLAEEKQYGALLVDSLEKIYTPEYLGKKHYYAAFPILRKVSRLKNSRRFLIQANACLRHDAYDELKRIQSPTLVIGADGDRVVGGDASAELAKAIPNSRLLIYPGLGHGVYEEAADFQCRLLRFLKEPDSEA